MLWIDKTLFRHRLRRDGRVPAVIPKRRNVDVPGLLQGGQFEPPVPSGSRSRAGQGGPRAGAAQEQMRNGAGGQSRRAGNAEKKR